MAGYDNKGQQSIQIGFLKNESQTLMTCFKTVIERPGDFRLLFIWLRVSPPTCLSTLCEWLVLTVNKL